MRSNGNTTSAQAQTFDAIVVGSGISGGLAAKELCEKGLRTLVLERGRDVRHIVDYPTATLNPWELLQRNRMSEHFLPGKLITTKCYAVDEVTQPQAVKFVINEIKK